MSASPESVISTIGTTLMASLPTILEALAVASPQDAIIAAAAVVIAQDIAAAIKVLPMVEITDSGDALMVLLLVWLPQLLRLRRYRVSLPPL